MIVVLTENQNGKIEAVIEEFCKNQAIDFILIRPSDFLDEAFQIFDRVSPNSSTINWLTPQGKKIINDATTVLINLIDFINPENVKGFHPDDKEYVRHELSAYLSFATSQFHLGISTPSGNSLCNKYISLPLQWAKIKDAVPECQVPDYVYSDANFFLGRNKGTDEQWIVGDLHSFRNWKPNLQTYMAIENQKSLYYKRPKGNPYIAFGFGNQVVIKPAMATQTLSVELEVKFKTLILKCSEALNLFCYECIFFSDSENFTFGSMTGEIERSSGWGEFAKAICSYLSNPSRSIAWTMPRNHRVPKLKKTQKAIEQRIHTICGSSEDSTTRTVRCLTTLANFNFLEISKLEEDWNFAVENGRLFVGAIVGKDWQECDSFYIGPIDINDSSEYRKYSNFFEIINSLDIPVIGCSENMHLNGTKPTQLVNASLSVNGMNLKTPETYIVSGPWLLVDRLIEKHGSIVVKSISGIRSRAVDNQTFSKWDRNSLKFGPQMFQEKIEGEDLRVHVCGKSVDSRILKHKSDLDYRYATDRSEFESTDTSRGLEDIAIRLAESEHNPLVGIDFILQKDKETGAYNYYLLEINPGPAWTFFYQNDEEQIRRFSKTIVHWLQGGDEHD